MKPIWTLAGFLTLGIAAAIHAEVLIKPNDPNINYYGRFDFSNSATTVPFNWPGSVIEAGFPGPSIGVELNDGNGSYFNVEIDGALVDSLLPTTTTHRTIRTNLSAGNHTIRITLRSNGLNCSFSGFYLANGMSLVAPPAKPLHKIEFIGDSWTAGDVIGQTTGTPNLKYFNASLTYARRSTIAFHAQDILVARGGAGLIKSQGNAATMPTRYPKTLCDGTANWDFNSWTPDLAVIFLGINDYTIGGVTDTNFRATYRTFINTVRGHYPNVPLILVGLAGSTLTNVQAVATSFTGTTVFSSPITLANAKALYQHPNQAQHQQIADSLVAVIKRVMGWDTAATVGIQASQTGHEARTHGDTFIKTSLDKIVFPADLTGVNKEIIAFDYSGRSIRKWVTEKQTVFLTGDMNLPAGLYFLKTRAVGK